MTDPSLELPQALSERYRATRELGRGAFGRVLEAVRLEDGQGVAIKLLVGEVAQEGVVRERFFREGRAGTRLQHPNVVRVLELAEGEEPYLIQELVPGGSLEERITAAPSGMDPDAAGGFLEGILAGLMAAHQEGLTHRDLKPANILLDAEGCPKLADFGLAHGTFEATLTATGTILGTPLYMAPAQVMGETPSPAWDVYAAAAIYYEMLVGRPAFSGRSFIDIVEAKRRGLLAGPSVEGAPVSPGVDKLLRTALGPDHALHFPDVASFRKAWSDLRKLEELGLDTPTALAEDADGGKTSVLGEAPAPTPASGQAPAAPAPASTPAPEPRARWPLLGVLVVAGLGVGWVGGLGEAKTQVPPAPPPVAPEPALDPRLGEELEHLRLELKEDAQVKQVQELVGNHQDEQHRDEFREAAGVVEQAFGAIDFVELARLLRAGRLPDEARRSFLEVAALHQVVSRMSLGGQMQDFRGPRQQALDDAYAGMVRVRRMPDAPLVRTNIGQPPPPVREEAFGQTWARIRGSDTYPVTASDNGTYANCRVRRRSPRGIPFEDPVSRETAFLVGNLNMKRDVTLIEVAPYQAELPLAEVPSGDLELIVRALGWYPSIQLRLELRGVEGEVTVPVSLPLVDGVEPKFESAFLYHRVWIDRALFPGGLAEVSLRFTGIQPATDGEAVVYLFDVWQRVE
jgi:serine/threonine-protein kinase